MSGAACVAIGDELIAGDYPDSNSGMIAQRLAELGIAVQRFVVLGDDRAKLAEAFRELAREHALVITTGGLGPTLDDVSREAAADAAGVELERDEPTLAWLRELYASRKRPMPESNERQAWFPRGAAILANPVGTARGFRVALGASTLAVLPGPPHEAREMLEHQVLPWLRATHAGGAGTAQHVFYLLGLPESAFADRAGAWMRRDANPLMGVTAHSGVLKVTLRSRAADHGAARALLEPLVEQVRERFAAELFSEDDPRPAAAIVRELAESGLTLATAESCTGGLVAQLLTEIPGASAVFKAGWITYADEAKVRDLGVDPALIARHGAVSAQVAEAMARGAAERAACDVALSLTGIAGPGGGTPEKPVGLVWFGLARGQDVQSFEMRSPPIDRASIRRYAAHTALDLIRRRVRAD